MPRSHALDLTGRVFGRLTVLSESAERPTAPDRTHWLCRCECGREKVVAGLNLVSGNTASCGCGRGITTDPQHPQRITRRQAAVLLGVSRQRLHQMIGSKCQVPVARTSCHDLFRRTDVLALQESRAKARVKIPQPTTRPCRTCGSPIPIPSAQGQRYCRPECRDSHRGNK